MAFAGTAALVDGILINPGVRQWLSRNDTDWRPEFADFVKERLALIETA